MNKVVFAAIAIENLETAIVMSSILSLGDIPTRSWIMTICLSADAAVLVLAKEDNIQVLIHLYSRRSPIRNRFAPFCAAVVKVLKGLL